MPRPSAHSVFEERLSALERLQDAARSRGISVAFSRPGDAASVIRIQRGGDLFLLRPEHAVYAAVLVDQFEYYFNSTVPEPRDGLRVADYSRPGWHELPSGGRMFYTSFAEDVGATDDYLAYLRPAPGETVLDVGAYCGYSVLTFSRAVGPSGMVHAFEPDPENFSALQRNVRDAGVANVTLRKTALSATSGPLLFSSEGNMGSAIVPQAGPRGPAIEIRSERLRTLIESGEIAHFDVAKIDIEGAEYPLLEDSLDVVRRTKARWAVEMHVDPVSGREIDVDRIRGIFDDAGYLSYLQCASDSAAAPTLFAYPDDCFPAAAASRMDGVAPRRATAPPPSGGVPNPARVQDTFGRRFRYLFTGR